MNVKEVQKLVKEADDVFVKTYFGTGVGYCKITKREALAQLSWMEDDTYIECWDLTGSLYLDRSY